MPTTISVDEFIESRCKSALSVQGSTEYGALRMPKFFFKTKVELIPMLKELGINKVFDDKNDELKGIVDGAPDGLYISMVRHEAGIKTDEEGTKAFAVTVTKTNMVTGSPDTSPDVVLNNPFVYFIRAGKNGLVLFAGVANNPNMQ